MPEPLADWLELCLLFGGDAAISASSVKDVVDEDGTVDSLRRFDDEWLGGGDVLGEPLTLRDVIDDLDVSPSELLVEDVWSVLSWRRTIVGESYPIAIDEAGLARRVVDTWSDCVPYAFMCCLSARYVYGLDHDINTGAKLFERLAAAAIQGYWHGEASHFGWPRDEAEEASFRAAFPALIRNMSERLTRRPDELPLKQKDLMVDAVAWRPLDHRRGQSVLLLQCATGDDWGQKGIHIEAWEKHVDFSVRPQRGLAVPFVPEAVKPELDWETFLGVVGIPFDRLRLSQLLDDLDLDPDLIGQMRDWVDPLVPMLAG